MPSGSGLEGASGPVVTCLYPSCVPTCKNMLFELPCHARVVSLYLV